MGHLTVFFARTAGHFTKDFQKSQLPGGGGLIAVGIDSYITTSLESCLSSCDSFSIVQKLQDNSKGAIYGYMHLSVENRELDPLRVNVGALERQLYQNLN